MSTENKKLFFLLTNIPGSGKSTVGRAIEQVAGKKGLKTHTINEFELFGEWLTDHKDEVTWSTDDDGTIVDLTSQQYVDVFDYVQDRMVEEFLLNYEKVDIIISEAARDVSGISYVPLFQYLVDELGALTDFVNLDVHVDNIEELKRRVRERGERQPNSASVAVVNLYLKEAKNYPLSTSTQTAAKYEEFIYSDQVNNSETDDRAVREGRIPDHLIEKIDGIMGLVLARSASGDQND